MRSSPIHRTPRVMQLEGLFDLPASKNSEVVIEADLPIEDRPWSVGLIVGPSGSGKTTLARELFGAAIVDGFDWPPDLAVIDAFPEMPIKDLTGLLCSVGFSSPPSWLRPFAALSNGEQFRVTLARALAENPELAVIDEFTSVVDRQVAKVASSAVAKAVRRTNRRIICLSCHYDVEDWLQPDWTYDTLTARFSWRSLQPRPQVAAEVRTVSMEAWRVFAPHHYLTGSANRSARWFLATVERRPAALVGVISFPHATAPGWREHRCVCLPDFQGVGLGSTLSEYVASLYRATGKPYRSVTSHPGFRAHRLRSPLWRQIRAPSLVARNGAGRRVGSSIVRRGGTVPVATSANRLTSSFEYVGPANPGDAKAFGVLR